MTKIDKYDTTVKLLGAVTAALLLVPIMAQTPQQLPLAGAQEIPPPTIAGPECTNAVPDKISLKASSIDYAKAVSLASDHKELKARTQGYNSAFHVIITDWSFDSDCNVALKNINVFYHVSDSKGWVKYVVITEDAAMTKVISVSEQTEKVEFHNPLPDSANWSGYEFWANSGATIPIYEAKATWAVPAVSKPANINCTATLWCDLSISPGLYKGSGFTPLAHGGSEGRILCNTCTPEYRLWMEFKDSVVSFCSTPVSSGNQITSTTTNQAKTGGSNTMYNIVVQNDTTGQACAIFNFSYTSLPDPKYSNFKDERVKISGVFAPLAQFNQNTMTGTLYYSGASHSIYEPYSNNFHHEIYMKNGGNQNIGVSSVTTGGRFTQSWLTSAGTG